MAYILQVDFPYEGPWGSDMEHAMKPLADSIALEKGLIWKIWTENQSLKEAGGIYLFTILWMLNDISKSMKRD